MVISPCVWFANTYILYFKGADINVRYISQSGQEQYLKSLMMQKNNWIVATF